MSTSEKSANDSLYRVIYGCSDPTPTRRMFFTDSHAMEVDEWWSNYFLRERAMIREEGEFLRDHIKLMESTIEMLIQRLNKSSDTITEDNSIEP